MGEHRAWCRCAASSTRDAQIRPSVRAPHSSARSSLASIWFQHPDHARISRVSPLLAIINTPRRNRPSALNGLRTFEGPFRPLQGDLRFKIFQGLEPSIHRGKPQIGDVVQLPQGTEDGQADLLAGDLAAPGRPQLVLHPLGEERQRILADRSALTRLPHPGDHLGAGERLDDPRPLDHRQCGRLHGGEAPTAFRTRPAPPNRRAIVGHPAVHHPAVRVTAERTVHRYTPSLGDEAVDDASRPVVNSAPPGHNLWITYTDVTTTCWGATLARLAVQRKHAGRDAIGSVHRRRGWPILHLPAPPAVPRRTGGADPETPADRQDPLDVTVRRAAARAE